MLITRKIISIVLLCSVGVGLFWQTGTVVNFYANQKEITAKYCENKDKPQMNCHGKCHLKKQLTVKKLNPDNLVQTIQEISFWIYGVELIDNSELVLSPISALTSKRNFLFIQEDFLSEIFIPPSVIA